MNLKKIYKNFEPFIKYGIVGISGTLVDLVALYIFVEYLNFTVIPAAMLSFLLAVLNNFILNKIWTFKSPSKNYRKLFIKFLIVSLIGLGLTVSLMYLLVNLLQVWYMLAKVCTSAIVVVWNFLANKFWTFKIRKRELYLADNFHYELSVIIPAYNEENRIKNTLILINNYLNDKNINAEIIVVSDGSRDKTTNIVEQLKPKIPNLKLIPLSGNHGKGHAVKTGVEHSLGRYILFVDADNSTPIEEYEKLFNRLKQSNCEIAIGSRYLHDSSVKIRQSRFRITLGRIGNILIRLFLIDDIKDTQCGFKLFTHKSAKEIFSFQKVKRFGFDMEVLVIAENLGYKIVEVPVSWFNSAESRFRPLRDAIITLKDLVYIKLNLISGRYHADH